MSPARSNHFVLDNLVARMWEIRDRLREDPQNRRLEQQWIFIRRVVARSLVRKTPRIGA
jgi:hypothetical protein